MVEDLQNLSKGSLDVELLKNVVKNKVCVCPEGFHGVRCQSQLFKKCFVNITDPPVYDPVGNCQQDLS